MSDEDQDMRVEEAEAMELDNVENEKDGRVSTDTGVETASVNEAVSLNKNGHVTLTDQAVQPSDPVIKDDISDDAEIDKNWNKVAETSPAVVTSKKSQPAKGQVVRYPWRQSHWSKRDTKDYRNGYLGKSDRYSSGNKNYEFYTNTRKCEPDHVLIDVIHKHWWGNYEVLEYGHGYIQWLFPIRERGLNWEAQELQQHEIKDICEDKAAHGRVLKSYEMMLDFYGMKLVSSETGELARADNYEERFRHLNRSMHNYLRITRILKSLGEFKYEHLKKPFLMFVLQEAIKEGTLNRTLDSCMNYWVEVLRGDKQREELIEYAKGLWKEYHYDTLRARDNV